MRSATPEDAEAIAAIYAPIVAGTAISFELDPPSVAEMRARIGRTLERLPWLVSVDAAGVVEWVLLCEPAPRASSVSMVGRYDGVRA